MANVNPSFYSSSQVTTMKTMLRRKTTNGFWVIGLLSLVLLLLIPEGASALQGDLNGDGKADLVWRNTTTGAVAVWLMNGTAVASTGFPAGASLEWSIKGVGDTNGDGKGDLVWRNTTTGAVAVWLMNGTTVASTGVLAGPSLEWSIRGVGDTNGDGKADLVWRNTTTGAVAVWLMNGTAVASTGFPAGAPLGWNIKGVGDTNGDGKADLVWRNTTTGAVAVWLMNGTMVTSTGTLASAPLDWSIKGVGDTNGDGKADLVWRNTTTGAVAVWLLNGTTIASTGFPAGAPLGWQIAGVGDVDADGKVDIIWRNNTSGTVAVWLMNGPTTTSTGFPGSTPPEWKIQGSSDTDSLQPNPPLLNNLVNQVDVHFPALGLPIRIIRTYLLDSSFEGPLGYGWAHSFLMHVVEISGNNQKGVPLQNGTVKIFNQDGSVSFFKPTGGGNYKSPQGDFRVLTKSPGGTFVLKEKIGTKFNFDPTGKLTSIVDRNGNTVFLTYDENGRLDHITDASQQVTTFRYDFDNRIARITDPAGRSVVYEYDTNGNLASVRNNAGFLTAYIYDENHNLLNIIDPRGIRTIFSINENDQLVSVSNEEGNNAITYEYGTPNPNQMTISHAAGNQTIVTYNNQALITKIIGPLGNSTSFTYDNALNLIKVTDANGNATAHTYDARGNNLSTTDALGNTVTMTYEPTFNQITTFTDSKGNLTAFAYDSSGNRISTTYPDGSREISSYNANGDLASKTDRMNQTIQFVYDERGLLTEKVFPDKTFDRFGYDSSGNVLRATDENGTINFTYDSIDRLKQVDYPRGQAVSYAYDASNNRTQIAYPNGAVIDQSYDGVNRLSQITRSGKMVARYSYDQLGRVTRRDLGNGSFTAYSYDLASRLLDLVNKKSSSEVISSFSYTYDNIGNRLTMTTLAGTTQYTYDPTNQLTQVLLPDGSSISYNLDSAGNRSSVVGDGSATSYTTNNLNQYTDVGGDTYTHDANGNFKSKTTAKGETVFNYDFENRLIQVETPTETIKYTYDPFGRRISRTTSTGTTNFIYDDKRIIFETDGSGSGQASYIFGIRIDEALLMTRGNIDFFYAQDGLGSVANLFDSSENIIESFSYDAFGTPSKQSKVKNPFFFTGREFESETGMYFYRARYYSPETGRFLSPDPEGFSEGPNLYLYASNNPITFIDPSGLNSVPPHNRGLACAGHQLFCEVTCHFFCPPFLGWLCGSIPGNVCHTCKKLDEFCNQRRGDPTFIQASKNLKQSLGVDEVLEFNNLQAQITVPCQEALVRGDVPIFGLAYGKNFREYRVEIGEGAEPKEWLILKVSQSPQEEDNSETELLKPGDLAIEGNLVTWDTGLKNYVYLPSHPVNHPIDLKGTYTIRLVVTGTDETSAEDRVTVHVGNVIPNAWGGRVVSPDQKVIMIIPEQAIMDSFRLMLVQSSLDLSVPYPKGGKLVGPIYEVREPGERFTKPATLQMIFSEADLGPVRPDQLGIYGYNAVKGKWEYLKSLRSQRESIVFTHVSTLHSHYVLMASSLPTEGSVVETSAEPMNLAHQIRQVHPVGQYLVQNTFEDGLGDWSNRDGGVGASVLLDDSSTSDGTKALKISNTNAGGNFAVNVYGKSFDAREFPVVQFDYRIAPNVKTNWLVKVEGRWYEIGFTDDSKDLKDQRVNIAHIGDIEGVFADDGWHTATFNLHDMLHTKTRHTQIEAMVMADWDVGGYMKLQFGHNKQGATYYIDNFSIGRSNSPGVNVAHASFSIDDFDQRPAANSLNGMWNTFTDGLNGQVEVSFQQDNPLGQGYALGLSYDVSQEGGFAGYLRHLPRLDLRDFDRLSLWVKSEEKGQDLIVGLKDARGNESKVVLSRYLAEPLSSTWQEMSIPLTAFTAIEDWGQVELLSFSFDHIHNQKGKMFVDQVQIQKGFSTLLVDNFERIDDHNIIGVPHYTYVHGAASVEGKRVHNSPNGVYRLSYAVDSGKIQPTAKEPKSFAGWASPLSGINCSRCETLEFRIRGEAGEENATIYLDDGNFRWGLELAKFVDVTTEWQKVTIPIESYAEAGVDMTHLDKLHIVFEGGEMSGTIYLDDIQLVDAMH
jgi:RHS repeat-associated protein